MRASHPAVRNNPDMFAPDGLSNDEMATLYEQRRPRREPEQHVPIMREEVELREEDAVLCVKAIRGGYADGDTHLGPRPLAVPLGAKLNKSDPVVKRNPGCFIAVVREGLDRTNAVRAITDRYETRRDENGAFILETDGALRAVWGDHKRFLIHRVGQWVSRSDPDVAEHPQRYEVIA